VSPPHRGARDDDGSGSSRAPRSALQALRQAVWLSALTLAIGLTSCADNRYSQNSDQRIEASRMAGRVREALSAGVDYKYDAVKVTALDGLVQLSGFVETSAQRASARAIAGEVPGVKSVENNLAVKN